MDIHFLTFSAKRRKFKIEERDGHGKVMDKYFVKSVGTLCTVNTHSLDLFKVNVDHAMDTI